jgi:regulation of enolase protein 1 (concanavalin A-like superfamily)
LEPRVCLAAIAPLGAGTGLVGNYFAGEDLQNLAYARKDSVVNFDWGSRSPASAVPVDHFSVRWVGKIQPQFSEPYTFHTITNAGARLWVNGQQVIDDWVDHTDATESVGTIELRGGELYDLKLEFLETTGTAVAKLLWSSPSTAPQVVPSSQLYSTGAGWLSGNWLNQDIGSPSRKGSVRSTGSVYTVQGSGVARTGGTSDQLHYVYQTLNGDGTITARLTAASGGGTAGRAGVMFRETLGEGSPFAALSFNPASAAVKIADADSDTDPGASLQYRLRRGVRTLSPPSVAPAGEWVRLVREGNYFRAYTSATGEGGTWAPAGNAVVPMGRTIYVGLAVSSGDGARTATAGFSDVSITPTVPLGGGIDSLRDWNLGNVFVDMVKQARQFNPPDFSGTAVAVDENGWPKSDFSTILQSGFDKTGHVYQGTYKVSFTGQATVGRWVSPGTIANQSYNPDTNTTTLDVMLNPKDEGDWYFGLNFTDTKRTADSPVNSGITNLRVIRPGYDPGTTQVFSNEYLRHLEQFSVLRFMSFANTNNNPVANWEDRTKPDEPRQSTNRGVAWEYAIDLANLTGKDLWVNVPGHATDDYVRNMAALFKQRLDPGRVVYVEYANEVWNFQFDQAQYNLAAAKAEVYAGTSNLNNDNTTSTALWAYRRHARRTKEIGELFASAFGPGAINTRVRPVLGAQSANSDTVRQPLAWLEKTYGAPSAYLYAVAVAPYFGTDGKEMAPGATADDVLDGMESSVTKRNLRHPMFSGLAAKYGLRSFAYEGGSATGGADGLDVKIAALLHPRMTDVTVDYLTGWYGSGGDLFEWFQAGPSNWTSPFGAWGLTNAVDNLESPKILGTVAVANGPKTAPSAGVVIPGQVDARFHTNAVATNLSALPVDPYLRYIGTNAQFDYIVRAPAAGTYYLRISAATPSSGKTIDVYLNDRSARSLAIPSNGTSDFETFVDTEPMALTMREGVNLVRLVVPANRPYNIESLKFTTSPDGGVGDTMPVIGGMGFSSGQTIITNGTFNGGFVLSDDETSTDALLVTATSDNNALLPAGSINVIGSGSARTLRLAPAAQAAGNANVTLAVTDAAGNTRSVLFTRLTVRPSAPTLPRATAVAPDKVEVAWNDNSSNETGFKIDASVSPDFRSMQTFTAPAGSTRFVAGGLKANTRYYFRVRSAAAGVTESGGGGTIESASTTVTHADTPTFANFPTTPVRAAALPNSVTGTTTTLSVVGADDTGEAGLTYTWQTTYGPGGATGGKAPAFSVNGTNAARTTTVTFFTPGSYTFLVNVRDADGQSTPSYVDVTVSSTLTRIDVLPKTPSIKTGGKLHFIAFGKDQFGADVPGATFTWSATGGKIESGSGQFTAPSTAGSVMVTATAAGTSIEGGAQVTVGGVVNPPPTVVQPATADPNPVTGTTTTLSVLATDNGGAENLRFTWVAASVPPGVASPVFSANGTNDAAITTVTFSGAGLYNLRVTISDGALSVTSAVLVDVRPTATAVNVTPAALTVPVDSKARFTAVVTDQFGAPMPAQPPFNWSVVGTGTIDAAGVYTAPADVGFDQIIASATVYQLSGTADVTIDDDGNATAPLVGEDIGSVFLAGSDSYSAEGVFTVRASGADVFTAPDGFRFLHRTVTGDVTVIARVTGLQNTDAWAKAGVMIRETTAPDSRFAYSTVTADNGVSFGRRTVTGGLGGSSSIAGPAAPTWVKLTRNGNSFTAFYSPDGQHWTPLGPARSINMASTSAEVGIFVTSHDDTRLCTATFDNVTVTPVTDLARGRPVLASSAAEGLEVRNVVDGNGGSRWESLPAVAPGAEQWVRVDLGSSQSISRVRLNWAAAFATSYRVQISDDGAAWTDLYSTSAGDGNVDDLLTLTGTGRYVRVFADAPSTTDGPIAVNDFNVFAG